MNRNKSNRGRRREKRRSSFALSGALNLSRAYNRLGCVKKTYENGIIKRMRDPCPRRSAYLDDPHILSPISMGDKMCALVLWNFVCDDAHNGLQVTISINYLINNPRYRHC
jgi:hypothetical protein